jgi:hypothetical protein
MKQYNPRWMSLIVKEDDVSMFKFASILFITAPKEEDSGLQEILNRSCRTISKWFG